jgi:hypothetical protein
VNPSPRRCAWRGSFAYCGARDFTAEKPVYRKRWKSRQQSRRSRSSETMPDRSARPISTWARLHSLRASEDFFAIVTVYIDESGTHGSGVTILGGWVGGLGQWATFDPKWMKLLKRRRGLHPKVAAAQPLLAFV